MVQANPKLLSLEDFIADYGDQDRYELIDGELIRRGADGFACSQSGSE